MHCSLVMIVTEDIFIAYQLRGRSSVMYQGGIGGWFETDLALALPSSVSGV